MDNMDSIEVRIPDEIREYKEKYGGFTFRQWIGIVLVGVVCVPVYYILYKHTVQTFAMIMTTLLAAPIGLIFFMPINGMNAEKMLPYFKRMFVEFGTVLKFQTAYEREVELEMMKDKKYRKKMKKLQKLERKNKKRIQRGSASEENEKLRAYRADVDAYYNALRKEKIDGLLSSKVADISLGLNRKEQKKLKKETAKMRSETESSQYLTEDVYGEPKLDEGSQGVYGDPYRAESMTNPLEGKATFEMSRDLTENEGTLYADEEGARTEDSNELSLSDSNTLADDREGNNYSQEDSVFNAERKDNSRVTSGTVDSTESNPVHDIESSTQEISGNKEVDSKEQSGSNPDGVGGKQTLSKRQQVLQYYRTHPNATKADCKAATGIEMRTIKRCWPKD